MERIARLLAGTGAIAPVVYVRAHDPVHNDAGKWNGVTVRPLSGRRGTAGDDALLLRHAIAATSKDSDPGTRHVLVSFYAAQEGPVGARAASELGIPHIIAIRGTDYSYGFHEPGTHAVLRQLLAGAAWITTTNDEQTRAVYRSLGLQNVTRIHNSLPDEARSVRHVTRVPAGAVRLFADCGYSYKKGTIVLLDAVAALCSEGLPLILTIAGDDESGSGAYWKDVRKAFSRTLGERIRFCSRIDADRVRHHLASADLYCSATLGEGCSLARAAAMVAGIPIASTRCGELADLAAGASHVRLADPADAAGFLDLLRETCADILARRMTIDLCAVEGWRDYFCPEREQEQWRACIEHVAR